MGYRLHDGVTTGGQRRLLYSSNLEEHVPPQHFLRSINQCPDLSDLRAHLADFFSTIGRPSTDPVNRSHFPGSLQTSKGACLVMAD